MRRLTIPLLLCVLLLVGCAAGQDPRERAFGLVPDRPYQVISAGTQLFTFTLESPARVVLESRTYPGDTGLVSPAGQLLDDQGRMVTRDWTSGVDSNFRIEERLAAGTWYLRVDNPHACRWALGCLDRDYRYEVLLTIEEAP